MHPRSRLACSSSVTFLLIVALSAAAWAAPPAAAGSHLQIPLFETNGSNLPTKDEICWVTNVCQSPVQAQVGLTDAFGTSVGSTINRQLGSWQSYDCDVVKQLGDFKAGRRTNDAGNMTSVAATLSDADIENLSQYIGNLY